MFLLFLIFHVERGVYMANRNKITNTQLCAALLSCGSVQETAKVLNISTRTIYNMMQDSEFIELYDHAQADLLNNVVIACRSHMTNAIDCIADIMNDESVNAQTRLLAAQTMLTKCLSLYESMQDMRKKAYNNRYDLF